MGHTDIATTLRYVTVTGTQLDGAIAQAFGQNPGKTGGASVSRI
jgi:site-specific recombinase XerD